MKLRGTIVFLHRWIALVAGVFWGIAALTGGVLVFSSEITRALDGGRFETTSESLPVGGLDRAFAEHFTGASVISVTWPSEPNVYSAWLREASGTRQVFLDGGTGEVIEPLHPKNPWVDRLSRLHSSLLAGKRGSNFVTLVSAISMLGLFTGLWLWWPGFARVFHGLKIRAARGLYVFSYDLHQTLGAATLVPLLIMTGTGVIMGTPGLGSRLAGVFLPETQTIVAPPSLASTDPGATQASIEALAAAAEAATGEKISVLAFPTTDNGQVEARLWEGGNTSKPIRVRLSRAEGRVLEVQRAGQRPREQRFGSILGTWHTARFRSLLARLVFAVACGLGPVIAVTGYTVWWLKRTRSLEVARNRAEAASA